MNKKTNIFDFKLWLILFTAISLVFSFYYITFFWGNHDWDWIKGTTQVLSLSTGMFEGRFAKFILNVFLFGGHILPILNNIVAFALFALGTALLVEYWQIKDIKAKIVIALIPMLSPFILGWLYFPINILGNFSAVALVSGGLLLSKSQKNIYNIFAIICFFLALGVYPSCAEMIIVCFCFRHILTKKIDYNEFKKSLFLIVSAFILFKLFLLIFTKKGWIVSDYYNLQTHSLQEIAINLPHIIKLVFAQLVETIPFMPFFTKLIGALIIILAIFSHHKGWQHIVLWLGIFFATVLSSALTTTPSETEFMPRVNFYGLNFLYTGALAVLLQNKNWQRNVGVFLSVLLLFSYIKADLYAQKVWFLGKKAEENLIERISLRIDSQIKSLRIPVVSGEISLRPHYYRETYQKNSPYILNTSFMVRHIPSGIFNFYAHQPLFYGLSRISILSDELRAYLLAANQPWPAEKSIYIDENYTIILLTPQGIDAIRAQLP